MNDQNIRIIEHYAYNETVLSPISILLFVSMTIFLLRANRSNAILPIVLIALIITSRQRIVIVGLDFTMIRLIAIAGLIRVYLYKEYQLINLTMLDKIFIAWVLVKIIAYTLLCKTNSAFINRLGFAFDAIAIYFLCRIFLVELEDVKKLLKVLILLSIPIALFMLLEQLNGRNLFSIFGGVPELTMERHGRLRSQGAFAHPILAGTYGAWLLPLAIGLYYKAKNKLLLIIGLTAPTIIVFASSSSGPLIAFMAGICGFYMYRYRRYIKFIIWLSVCSLILLDIVMKAPVYHLITRIPVVGGSTAYHRFHLIRAAINNFPEWFLIGTNRTAYWGWGLQDITNQYILEATTGGIAALILFMAILVICFKKGGQLIETLEETPNNQKFFWGICCSLFVHTVSFLSVSYFGQLIFFEYLTFAILSNFDHYKSDYNRARIIIPITAVKLI